MGGPWFRYLSVVQQETGRDPTEGEPNPGCQWELAEQARGLGPGSFQSGEVPGVGAGVPGWPHPTPWPQGMWA